ncbi:MAG TPA: NUDIX hydrolase [Xanthobacteraceae bacterium]|nr:NUDIX hydrolase [Xanthobacteraceae bacterium]
MYDDDHCLRRYRALEAIHADWFTNEPNCPMWILRDRAAIKSCQDAVRAERLAAGWAAEDLRVGVLAEDEYMGYVVRDAVRFSDGRFGLYNRVIASGGITVLPILGNGIVLIRIFRHSVRRWFLEAPQGHLPDGADPTEGTRRELFEEMGATTSEIISLGTVYTSSALTSENLKMFAARITKTGEPQRSEGIDSLRTIPSDDIDRLVLDGTICDGPTMSLITRARAHGLL